MEKGIEEERQGRRWPDYVAYLALRVVVALIQTMSVERCDRVCTLLAGLIAKHVPLRRKLVDANLRLVFPNWNDQQIAQARFEMWRHLLLMVCEIAHAPRKIHRTNWREHFELNNVRPIVERMISSRPLIIVTGHFGNFELAGFITGLFGLSSTTIARPLDNRFVHDYVNDFRSMNGQHLLPKEGSSGQVSDLLESGGTLALLADQYAGPKACWANFLGTPASCHKALALFTLTSQAPMIVTYNRRREKAMQFQLGFLGIADPWDPSFEHSGVQALTQWYNDRLGEIILRFPGQYWWVHNRWRGEPPARKSSTKAKSA